MASSGAQLSYCTMSIAGLGPPTLQPGEVPTKLRFENGISKPPIEPLPESTNFTRTFNGFRSTFNNSADIEGASPKRMRAFSDQAPKNIMCIDDIEGTRAKVRNSMFLTKRHVNPLEPHYSLPSFVPEEPVVPRQLRNTMDISDIEGSCAKVYRHRQTRDNLTTVDIVGAQASWKPIHKACRLEAPPHPIMEVGIPVRKNDWTSSRRTNVLEPHYFVGGREVQDDPKFTKPKPLKRFIPDNHVLQTHDIVGAAVKPLDPLGDKRREYKNINFLADISGAQTGSIKHSIVTMRATNPLMPVYQALDDGSELPPPVTSLIPPEIIEVPTINMKKTLSVPNLRPLDESMAVKTGNGGIHPPSLDAERTSAHRPPRLPIDKLSMPVTVNSDFVDTHHAIYGSAESNLKSYRSNSPIFSERSHYGNSARGLDSGGRNLMPLSDRRGSRGPGGTVLAPSASEPALPASSSSHGLGQASARSSQQQSSARRQAEARQREIEAVRSLQ